MRRAGALIAATVAAASLVAAGAQPAHGSRFLRIGIYDEAQTLYGPVDRTFALFKVLHVQEVRLNLYWGGRYAVAKRRPKHARDPADPAYDWSLYDRTVLYAAQAGVHVLFSIYGTPGWANGGKGANVAPKRGADLRNFAFAAATRYSGAYMDEDGRVLPAVREWLAWNEPNNPIFLTPQYRKTARGYVMQSPVDYAKICNAIYTGVHQTLARERVGCGVTGPRGNNNPRSNRPSISPLAFLRAVKRAGLRTFDAWAHHPYYGTPSETPASKPPAPRNGAAATAVTLGNIDTLIAQVTKLYGRKRIWITEYGYQTNPPDPVYGVTYAQQALYLKQAFAIARRNPRIDMMLWFLLKDEPTLSGWQSGLITYGGAKKPAFKAFMRLAQTLGR